MLWAGVQQKECRQGEACRKIFSCRRGTADNAPSLWQNKKMFTTYDDVMRHLNALGMFHMDLTLERMARGLRALGLERPPFRVAQIVGTNGKGSTATFLASLAMAHGKKTGLYTSPHFISPCERIRIDGMPLPPRCWPALARRVRQAEPRLTYFEFLTVLGVLAFAEAGVDVAVLEAGLGGHWDATTAVSADVVCFTPIGMDHEAVLGSTPAAIATDKACAMRPGVPALTGAQRPEVDACLSRAARDKGALLQHAEAVAALPSGAPLGLAGPHQRGNALLALAAWVTLSQRCGWPEPVPDAVRLGLRKAFLPGRLQRVSAPGGRPGAFAETPSDIILDGAHNPHGMASLRAALADDGITPGAVIFSCLADKNLENMLPSLHALAGRAPLLAPTIADNPRAAPSAALASRIGGKARALPHLRDALREAARIAGNRPVVVCGSLFLLAEFFMLYPQYLEPRSSAHGQADCDAHPRTAE